MRPLQNPDNSNRQERSRVAHRHSLLILGMSESGAEASFFLRARLPNRLLGGRAMTPNAAA